MTLRLDDAALDALLDALLPGGEGFPPASTANIGPAVRSRLGQDAETRLAAALLVTDGLAGLERDRPALFDQFRRVAYLAYYEAPGVIAAIRASGIDYRGAPQPRGYDLAPFDPATDAPTHARGRWKTTTETERGSA
jgi:hypothetical protein